ncbi:MAG: hypothetical protein ACJ8FC_02995 [Sphingomicrobium sp.]
MIAVPLPLFAGWLWCWRTAASSIGKDTDHQGPLVEPSLCLVDMLMH